MNDQDKRLDALFASARAAHPDTSAAEFAFETRLLARLRGARFTESAWAQVSWRLMPFFAACVLALTLWHAEAAKDSSEMAAISGLENPESQDLWVGLN